MAKCPNCGEPLSEWFVVADGMGIMRMWCYIRCKTVSPWRNHREAESASAKGNK